MKPTDELMNFLQRELALPSSSVALALRHFEPNSTSLPMTLWQYGLITLKQLELFFDWLENQ